MGRVLVSAPASEPFDLAVIKLDVSEDQSTWDSLLTSLIKTAREMAEHRTGRALITQTWKITLESFPCRNIKLPFPRLQSITHIKYLDQDGNLQTLAGSEYQVITDELIGSVQPAYGKSWPSARCQPGSVEIQFVCGYGNADAVPESIKTWMKMAIATWYCQREAIVTGTIVAELPRDFFAALLDEHTVSYL